MHSRPFENAKMRTSKLTSCKDRFAFSPNFSLEYTIVVLAAAVTAGITTIGGQLAWLELSPTIRALILSWAEPVGIAAYALVYSIAALAVVRMVRSAPLVEEDKTGPAYLLGRRTLLVQPAQGDRETRDLEQSKPSQTAGAERRI